MGKGAVVSALAKYLHPSEVIRKKFRNAEKGKRIDGLRVIRREERKIRRHTTMCLVMRHHEITRDAGEEVELYCTERWAKIISEGEKEGFFNAVEERRIEIDDHKGETEEEREPMQQEILRMAAQNTLTTDDIDVATNLVQTDNDNEPAPENIPSSNDCTDKILNDKWGYDGFCVR